MEIDKINPDRIREWHQVKVESYEIIFREGKERFNELLRESASITDKSIKWLTGLVTIAGTTSGILLNNPEPYSNIPWIIILYAFLLVVTIWNLIVLIGPKPFVHAGAPPLKSIPRNFDQEEDQDHQVELLYHHNILMLQGSIDTMDTHLNKRIPRYGNTLRQLFGVLLLSIGLVLLPLL